MPRVSVAVMRGRVTVEGCVFSGCIPMRGDVRSSSFLTLLRFRGNGREGRFLFGSGGADDKRVKLRVKDFFGDANRW